MNLEKLRKLKLRLVAEDDLEQIWDYFSTHLDRDPEFMKLGRVMPAEDHAIPDLVATVAAMALRNEGEEIDEPTLSRVLQRNVAKENFIHGVAILKAHMIRFFYFEDLDVGMLVVHLASGEFSVARLTGRRVPIQ